MFFGNFLFFLNICFSKIDAIGVFEDASNKQLALRLGYTWRRDLTSGCFGKVKKDEDPEKVQLVMKTVEQDLYRKTSSSQRIVYEFNAIFWHNCIQSEGRIPFIWRCYPPKTLTTVSVDGEQTAGMEVEIGDKGNSPECWRVQG